MRDRLLSSSERLERLVVLTGISGVNLGRVAEQAERVFGVPVYKFEDYLEDEFKAPVYHIAELLLMYYKSTAERFLKVYRDILGDAIASKQGKAIIAMHLTYHRRRHIVPNPVLHLLREAARRIVIVNYVDDYYHVLARLLDRVVKGRTPSVARGQVLDPISVLYWRAADHSYATFHSVDGVEVIQFANKHSREMHTRLLAYALGEHYRGASRYKKIYISHPITLVRRRAREANEPLNKFKDALEIEEFKEVLERKCSEVILFSPTSIDELIASKGGVIDTVITRENRWPHPEGLHEYPYPVDLSRGEFDEYLYPVEETVKNPGYLKVVRSLIEAQIESRDLAYVTQADMIIAYRPTMYKTVHAGVETEMKTAAAQSKPVYAIIPEEDGMAEYTLFRLEYPLRSVEEVLSILHC